MTIILEKNSAGYILCMTTLCMFISCEQLSNSIIDCLYIANGNLSTHSIFLHSTLIAPTRFVFRLFMCEHTRSTYCNAGRKINWSTRIEAHMERATINFPVVFCFSVSVSLYCLLAVGLEGPRLSELLAKNSINSKECRKFMAQRFRNISVFRFSMEFYKALWQ